MAGHDALVFVDGVSSIASVPFDMAGWRVDIAVAGSQKGFMLPAGLGLICISPKALKVAEVAAQSGASAVDVVSTIKKALGIAA